MLGTTGLLHQTTAFKMSYVISEYSSKTRLQTQMNSFLSRNQPSWNCKIIHEKILNPFRYTSKNFMPFQKSYKKRTKSYSGLPCLLNIFT